MHAPLHPTVSCNILCPGCRATDKKLKPANFVKVRHILCEKQSKVGRCRWSADLCAQLPPAFCSVGPLPGLAREGWTPLLQILEAQERIRNGEQFATVASDMSEDKARQGGDLGWKGRQDVVGAFAEAAFKLDVGPGSCMGALGMSAPTQYEPWQQQPSSCVDLAQAASIGCIPPCCLVPAAVLRPPWLHSC